jgi:hypothetical protein
MYTGILLVQAGAFGILSASVASNNNRSVAGWLVIGFVFGLFGFIASIVVGEGSSTNTFDPEQHDKNARTVLNASNWKPVSANTVGIVSPMRR